MKKLHKWIILGGIILILAVVLIFTGNAEEGTFGITRPSAHLLFDSQVDNKVSISYDGDTDVINTDSAHSLVVGDVIRFETGSQGFDGGFEEDVDYYVITASISTSFEISSTSGGTVIDIEAAASAAGGEFFMESMDSAINADGKSLYSFSVVADDAASAQLSFVGSISGSVPDFLASPSHTNIYEFLDVIDAQDGSSIDGDTGLRIDGTDTYRTFYIDDARTLNWLGVIIEDFASGSFTIQLDAL